MIPRWRRLVLVLCALAGLAASPAAATRTYTSDLTALDQAAKVAGLEALLEAHRPDPARTLAAEAAEPRSPASSNAGFTLFGPRPRAPLLTARAGGSYRLLATPCPSFRLCAEAALPVPWRPPELPDPDRLAVPEPAANHRLFGIGFPQVALSANPLPQKSFRLFEPSARSNESARARWLDTRTGAWLSEDPLGAVDSPNLFAFVAWQPSMGTDPMGMCLGFNDEPCYVTANRWAGNLESVRQRAEADGSGWVSIGLNTLSGSAIDLVELIAVDPLRAGSSTGEAVGSGAGGLDIALATVEDVGRVAALAGGAGLTVKAAGRGARGLRRAVSLSDELGDAVSAGVRDWRSTVVG